MKEDTLKGFEIGADDYMTKPFNMEELIARINAVLKRSYTKKDNFYDDVNIGKFVFNPKMQTLKIDDNSIRLTTKESDLLKLLCKNHDEILERNHALKAVWGDDNYFNGRSMDVYIAKLRKYLKSDPQIQDKSTKNVTNITQNRSPNRDKVTPKRPKTMPKRRRS